MNSLYNQKVTTAVRTPWNKDKLIGPKPPLRPKHVWSIRSRLQLKGRTRDLALFNLAIDSKLRGCDIVRLRVQDVAPRGHTVDRAIVRQRKTGRPVKFEVTEQTRESVDSHLRQSARQSGQYLFPGRGAPDKHLTTRQYARLFGEWLEAVGVHLFKPSCRPRREAVEPFLSSFLGFDISELREAIPTAPPSLSPEPVSDGGRAGWQPSSW